ncbi:MAG: DUF5688 family protein, partial [Lachnospiraceae bacterium]|nr:DUF5688 family protein [Lachnospiraceae bacterium]
MNGKESALMNEEEFAAAMERTLRESLGEKAVLQKVTAEKPNGVRKEGLITGCQDARVRPVIYPAEFYEDYRNGKSVGECVQAALELLKGNACRPDMETEGNFIRNILKWDAVRDKVYPYLINRSASAGLL